METRAHHLLIGVFMLLLIAGMFSFIIWLARGDFDRALTDYDIFFEGSVAGLSTGATAQFNGVPVGTVTAIDIVPDQPDVVNVVIRIDEDTPVKADTIATLEAQGFTGVAIVQLTGGSADAPALTRQPGQNRPRIHSERSGLQVIFENAPRLLEKAINALDNVDGLLGAGTRERVDRILANTAELTDTLVQNRDQLEQIITRANDTLATFQDLGTNSQTLLNTAQSLADNEIKQALAQSQDALGEAQTLLAGLNATLEENRDAITGFTNTALPESTR